MSTSQPSDGATEPEAAGEAVIERLNDPHLPSKPPCHPVMGSIALTVENGSLYGECTECGELVDSFG